LITLVVIITTGGLTNDPWLKIGDETRSASELKERWHSLGQCGIGIFDDGHIHETRGGCPLDLMDVVSEHDKFAVTLQPDNKQQSRSSVSINKYLLPGYYL